MNTPFHNPNKKPKTPAYALARLATISFLALMIFDTAEGPVHASVATPQVVDQVAIHHQEVGGPVVYTLPVYEAGDIRFLSGGVGIEEREATYPAFSVKLILAQQQGAFLTHASILIQDSEGQTVLDIPQELVTGPWVFVNLPVGEYKITAKSRNGIRIERTIRVKTGKTQVHHLIWPGP